MTKNVKIIIGLLLVIFFGYVIYNVNKTSKEGTESFSKFDPSSTANKTIKVEFIQEKGITKNPDGGSVFFVRDKAGVEKRVSFDKELPEKINDAEIITLTGHLHGDFFHAVDVTIEK